MNYDEDLGAPIWDELNENTSTSFDELTGALSNLSTNEPPPIKHNDENEPKKFAETHESLEEQHDRDPIEGIEHKIDEETSTHLLEELAPESEAFADLNKIATTGSASPIKTKEDPLFTGSTFFPLVGSDEQGGFDEEADDGSAGKGEISPKRKAGRPQQLFKSARVRRRPVSVNAQDAEENSTKGQILDPLGGSKKESEFIDEPLEDTPTEIKTSSKNDNIIDLVDEPLFKLSPRKKADVNIERNKRNDDVKLKGEQPSQEQDERKEELETFEIEVKDPVKVGELTSTHIEYSVITKSKLLENEFAQVNRRYTDFRWLYRQLQSNHWGRIIPPPPEKQSVGRFKQDFIENRRFQMERMLRKIVESPILRRDSDFLMFLSNKDFVLSAKTREHISGSAASADSNDLSEIHISDIELLGSEDAALLLRNGGIDAESQKRFMNISFSSTPKYIETDEYFRDHWRNAQVLEEQLRQLDKSLELVDAERNELASVTEEFSKTIESLADLEVTKKNADLLLKFAETQRRIKESLERSSLQESLTLGVTLDEYVRSLASFKAIFNQRARLGQYLVIVEADLSKKESQVEKLHNIFKTQPNSEKVQVAKKDYQILKTRFNNIKKNWQAIGNRIKDEVENYQLERVKDFRNSIEIFLESAIESQKENIELWETFYQNYL